MDGTFKASPQIFEQLYSIHATYRGHVVPVVYALLPDKLNRYVRRLHPNLHQLVKELQKEQAMTQVTVQRARLGGAPPARRMKYVRIDEEVQRLTQRFDSDDITAMDYIAGLRRVIHHY